MSFMKTVLVGVGIRCDVNIPINLGEVSMMRCAVM